MKKYLVLISLIIPSLSFAATTISTDITTTGKIGIGSTTPYSKLSIDGTATPSGTELITNGTFTGSASGWTLGGNVAYSSNNVVSTYAGGDPSLSTTFQTIAGKTYLITFTVSNANAPMYYYLSVTGLTYDDNLVGNGTHTIAFKTDNTGTETITFDDSNYFNGDTWTLDDVSIKETSALIPALTITGYNGKSILSIGDDILANTAIGLSAFSSNTTGNYNTAFGSDSLYSNTIGNTNTALGSTALYFNTAGDRNTATGWGSLVSNTTGSYNVGYGAFAAGNNKTGSENTAIGTYSLSKNTTGSGNVALGYLAGLNETGSNTFYLGNSYFSSSALEKAGSLLYGTFNGSTPANQTLTINASTTISQNLTVNGGVNLEKGTSTVSTNAVTISKTSGVITDSTDVNTDTTRTAITLTNTRILTTSVVVASICSALDVGAALQVWTVPGSGSASVLVRNSGTSNQTSDYKVCFIVTN
jgi:hypothetical protein